MKKIPNDPEILDQHDISHEISGLEVQQALHLIFQSAPFRASKQSQHLLQYIVDQTLAGHREMLKERIIGINVFGRRPDYDTSEDPIVRARTAEVRKRLAQFYLGEGSQAEVRIQINTGSYLASFLRAQEKPSAMRAVPAPTVSEPERVESPDSVPPPPPFQETPEGVGNTHRKKKVAGLLALVCLLIALTAGVWGLFRPATPIDIFWKPLLDAPKPALLYSGANVVYGLSNQFLDQYKATHHLDSLERQGLEFAVPMSPDLKLEPKDLVVYRDAFTTLGDLAANVDVATLLVAHRKKFDLRCGQDVAFGDLNQSPTVLIGAFNNSWTMRLTGNLPFIFEQGAMIRERDGKKRSWSAVFSPGGQVATDYALVTRIPQSKTGQALIAIAGITQSGTRAAADFITDSGLVKKLAARLPKDWSQKNLQFVLQTKVVDNIPTSPVVVALKSW